MSRYAKVVTLTVAGDEMDLPVRCHVQTEPSASRGWTAELDGDPEALFGGRWVDVADLDLDAGDAERIEEALCEAALSDDRSECIEWGDDFTEIAS